MFPRFVARLVAAIAVTLPTGVLTAQPPVRPAPAPSPAAAPTPAPVPALIAPTTPGRAPMASGQVTLSTIGGTRLARAGQRITIDGQSLAAAAPLARDNRAMAPAAWDAQDPADSLYREARKALTGDSYQRSAELFKQIRQKYPRSSYAPDAPYWEAFALQRLGGQQNLYLAHDALGLQQRDYPKAATRGDAAALNARIETELGRRGDALAAQNVVGRARRAADDGCPRAGEDERVDALNAVTQMDAERAMPILKKVLARREPCTQQLRRTAVWLVARQKSAEAAQLLMNSAKTDPDREVREQAVFWLANVPSDEAVTMLVDLARNGDDLELRKRAVYALSRNKSEKAAAILRDIAGDTRVPEELRAEALNWTLWNAPRALRDGTSLFAYAKEIYAKAEGAMLKQTALRYIAGLRSDESRQYLVQIALNDRELMDLRRTAITHLASGGGYSNWTPRVTAQTSNSTGVTVLAPAGDARTEAVSRPPAAVIIASLWQVYEKSSELELRRQVLSSLGSMRDNAGTDKLIDVARNEKNTELRRAAITYLSRSKDPRAIELLQEIINK